MSGSFYSFAGTNDTRRSNLSELLDEEQQAWTPPTSQQGDHHYSALLLCEKLLVSGAAWNHIAVAINIDWRLYYNGMSLLGWDVNKH